MTFGPSWLAWATGPPKSAATFTIAICYHSAQNPTLILPSLEGYCIRLSCIDNVVVAVVVISSSFSGHADGVSQSQSVDLDMSTMLNPDLSDEPPLRLPSHTSNFSPKRSLSHSPNHSQTLPHQTTVFRWPCSGSVTDENSYSVASSDDREPAAAAAAWCLLRQDSADENVTRDHDDDDDDRHWDDNIMPSTEHFDHHANTAADAVNDDDDIFYDACDMLSTAQYIASTLTAQSSTASDDIPTLLCNGRLASSDYYRPTPTSSKSSSPWSSRSGIVLLVILSSTLLAGLLLLCGLVMLAYVVLESQVDLPLVASIRRLPEVCQFYHDQYGPWRVWVTGAHSHTAGTLWRHCVRTAMLSVATTLCDQCPSVSDDNSWLIASLKSAWVQACPVEYLVCLDHQRNEQSDSVDASALKKPRFSAKPNPVDFISFLWFLNGPT